MGRKQAPTASRGETECRRGIGGMHGGRPRGRRDRHGRWCAEHTLRRTERDFKERVIGYEAYIFSLVGIVLYAVLDVKGKF